MKTQLLKDIVLAIVGWFYYIPKVVQDGILNYIKKYVKVKSL